MKKILALAVLLAACAGTRDDLVPADEPLARGSATPHSHPGWTSELEQDEFDAAVPLSAAEAAKSGGASTSHVHPSEAAAHEHHHEQEQTIYTCPMHSDVTSTSPGKCPKCGMTLVPRRQP